MASVLSNVLSGAVKAGEGVAKKIPSIVQKFTSGAPQHEFSGAPYSMASKVRQEGSE